MAALARGYFSQEGLDVQLVDFTTGAQMIPPLATGDLEIGSGGIAVGLFAAIARGIPLKIVADQTVNSTASRSTGWLVRKELVDSGKLRSEADFRGLRVALGGTGTIVDVELDELLRRGSLTHQDVEELQIPYPDQLATFANNGMRSGLSFEPTRTRMIKDRRRQHVEVQRRGDRSHRVHGDHVRAGDGIETGGGPPLHGRLPAGHPRRPPRGPRAAASDQMLDYLVAETAIKDRDLWRRMNLQWTNPDGYNYPTSIERDVRWFVDNGQLERTVALGDVLDQSYVDYAIQQLGNYTKGS